MRRAAVLVSVFLTLFVLGLQANLVTAFANSNCALFDQDGIVYDDWYHTTYVNVLDNVTSPGTWRRVNADLKAWRLSVGGACHRAYYASAWTSDGSGGQFDIHMRVWIGPGGNPSQEFDSGSAWGNRGDVVTRGWTAADQTAYIPPCPVPAGYNSCVGGAGRLVDFANYGDYTRTPRADNYHTLVWSGTWTTPDPAFSCAPGESGCDSSFFVNF